MSTRRLPSREAILLIRKFNFQPSLLYEQVIAARSVRIHRSEVHPHHSLVVVLKERVVREDVGESRRHILNGGQVSEQIDICCGWTIAIEEIGLLL